MDVVIAEHLEAIAAYCGRRLPLADARDATSEVFLIAWRDFDRLPRDERLRPWLYGIARNVVAHSRRSHARRTRLDTKLRVVAPRHAESPEVQVLAGAEQRAIVAALLTLRPDDQEVLRLRAWEELTHREIAVVLDISPDAAEKRVARALERLAKAMGQQSTDRRRRQGGAG